MKTWTILLAGAVLVGGLTTVEAARKPSVMLEVSRKMHTDRTKKDTRGRGNRGKRTVTSTASMEITIDLWNTDPKERTYDVKWYYIADPAESGEDDYVFEKGSEQVTLEPRAKKTLTHESGTLTETRVSGDKSSKEGGSFVGFIVVVHHGEDVVAYDASSWTLKRLMQNPASRKAFLESQTL